MNPLTSPARPGRVNLLGEHVDYNDGFVLPAAIDRATYIAFSPSTAPHSTVLAVDLNQSAFFSPQPFRQNPNFLLSLPSPAESPPRSPIGRIIPPV